MPTKTPKARKRRAGAAKQAVKRSVGQPSIYTDEIAATICQRLADGESLRQICADADMPARQTVRDWKRNVPGFGALYEAARVDQTESELDDLMEIEQQVLSGDVEPDQAKVAISSKQWRMSRFNKNRFGDRVIHAGDDQHPLRVKATLEAMSDADVEALAAVAGRLKDK